MSALSIAILAIVCWIGFIAIIRLAVIPRLSRAMGGDPLSGLLWHILRQYTRLVHRATFHGMESLRNTPNPGPLLVVSNHTGSVDPLLIQAGCRFRIRWMMASEMMSPKLDWLWRREQPIPVDRNGRDANAAREAIRHLKSGGIVGLFPEGRIVCPPRQIRPFFPGVGLIVVRSKAPVLLVWVSGTPDTTELGKSIFTRSRARVEFIDLIDFSNVHDAHAITQQLRVRLAQASGWPLTDEPQPPAERELAKTAETWG